MKKDKATIAILRYMQKRGGEFSNTDIFPLINKSKIFRHNKKTIVGFIQNIDGQYIKMEGGYYAFENIADNMYYPLMGKLTPDGVNRLNEVKNSNRNFLIIVLGILTLIATVAGIIIAHWDFKSNGIDTKKSQPSIKPKSISQASR